MRPKNIHSIWDAGESVFDRLTVVLTTGDSLGLSLNPDSPQGFSQYCGKVEPGAHLGRKVSWYSLPDRLQKHIANRIKEN
jgi:hypothetical protein